VEKIAPSLEELTIALRGQITRQLNLENIAPEEWDENMPLFGEGLGLDSIDALELIVLLHRNYNIKIGDPKEARKIFYSVRTMAEYIHEHSPK
jgi:acyl carrier protein